MPRMQCFVRRVSIRGSDHPYSNKMGTCLRPRNPSDWALLPAVSQTLFRRSYFHIFFISDIRFCPELAVSLSRVSPVSLDSACPLFLGASFGSLFGWTSSEAQAQTRQRWKCVQPPRSEPSSIQWYVVCICINYLILSTYGRGSKFEVRIKG